MGCSGTPAPTSSAAGPPASRSLSTSYLSHYHRQQSLVLLILCHFVTFKLPPRNGNVEGIIDSINRPLGRINLFVAMSFCAPTPPTPLNLLTVWTGELWSKSIFLNAMGEQLFSSVEQVEVIVSSFKCGS